MAYQVNGSRVEWNPTAARLRELTEEMPNATLTEFGNVNVKARVDSRSTRSTYIVDDSTNSRGQTITRQEYDRIAAFRTRISRSPTWSWSTAISDPIRSSAPGRG